MKNIFAAGSALLLVMASAGSVHAGTWQRIAGEWQPFDVEGTKTVRYGAGSTFIQKTVSGDAYCTNDFFGRDPLVGTTKFCEVYIDDSPTATNWTRVATEGQSFTVQGTKTVRYGLGGVFVEKTVTNNGSCSNAYFGRDPVYGKTKYCEVLASGVSQPPPVTSPPVTPPTPVTPKPPATPIPPVIGLGGIPSPASIAGKPIVGRIDAKSGQVIENVHVVNPNGPCIVIFQNVTNVTIRNSEIGPCGSAVPDKTDSSGILILQGAGNIRIERNVIHSVSNGVHTYQSRHPIIFDRNFVYNVRGPFPAGQMIQLHTVQGGSGRSKVTCNISDATYGTGVTKAYEDHISIFGSHGTASDPIEIAYNRIRGGTSQTGSGMMLGDKGGSNIWAHHNTVVTVANAGIGVAGGSNITVSDNRVDNRGANLASKTHMAYSVRGFDSCNSVALLRNRGIARLWAWNNGGVLVDGYGTDASCRGVDLVDNKFGDTSLSPAIFDEAYAECR